MHEQWGFCNKKSKGFLWNHKRKKGCLTQPFSVFYHSLFKCFLHILLLLLLQEDQAEQETYKWSRIKYLPAQCHREIKCTCL